MGSSMYPSGRKKEETILPICVNFFPNRRRARVLTEIGEKQT